MNVSTCHIDGVYILEPTVHADSRGYFMESYNKALLSAAGIDMDFVQDNEAYSTYGVLRGLHYQTGDNAQAKLVRVVSGEVLDVIVDIRTNSSTYGKHYSIRLSGENKKQMLVPKGMAHGYVVLSETAIFAYKCDQLYAREAEGGIRYNDPQLGIDWIVPSTELIVSDKDLQQPTLGDHKPYI